MTQAPPPNPPTGATAAPAEPANSAQLQQRALIQAHKEILITRSGGDLAQLANGALARSRIEPTNIAEMTALAQILAQGEVMRMPVTGSATETRAATGSEILGCIMTGADMGLSAMQSVRGLYNIGGKWAAYVKMLHAIVRASPLCKELRQVTSTEDLAVWFAWRTGDSVGSEFEYGLKRAKVAGLAERSVWRKNPWDMLSARALGLALSRTWPDLVQGLSAAEDLIEAFAVERDEQAAPNHWSNQPPRAPVDPPRVGAVRVEAPVPVAAVPEVTPAQAHADFMRGAAVLARSRAQIEDAAIQVADQPDLAKLTPTQRVAVLGHLRSAADASSRPVDADAAGLLSEARQIAPGPADEDIPF